MAPTVRLFSRPRLPPLVGLMCAVSVSLNLFFVYSTRHHGRNIVQRNIDDPSNYPFDKRDNTDYVDAHIPHHHDVRSLKERESREQEVNVEQTVMTYKERRLPDQEPRLLDQKPRLPDQEPRLTLPQVDDLGREDSHEAKHTEENSKKLDESKTLEKSKAPDITATLPPCPNKPTGLEGQVKAVTAGVEPEGILKVFSSLEEGGRLRPKDCLPSERLAIIFPYRNRWPHLHITLFNLIPVLIRQKADATFFVIDQTPTATFNRGALLNIGFLEAEKMAAFDCYIFHDVDLIPLNDHNMYRCGDRPRHFASAMNKHGYRLMYDTFFGGVVGFSKKQYRLVNGNSNIYFGWGGEDDDLWQRVHNKNMTVARYDDVTSRYLMIKHTLDKGNEKNTERKRLLRTAMRRQDVEGLNTTQYDVLSIEVKQLYTWITVSLDLMTTINTAPSYTKHDIWKLVKTWRIYQRQPGRRRMEEDGADKDT